MTPGQIEVALQVGRALEEVGCTWMIGGSVATSAQGAPRSTHDVDLVADVGLGQAHGLVERLEAEFYVDADMIREAVRRSGCFNVIHYATAEKVDVFCLRADEFAREGLRTRVIVDLGGGRSAPAASAAHMVVEKLRWYRRGGEVSDRQWRDVQGVLQVGGAGLDVADLRRWAADVGVGDLLERALGEAGMG